MAGRCSHCHTGRWSHAPGRGSGPGPWSGRWRTPAGARQSGTSRHGDTSGRCNFRAGASRHVQPQRRRQQQHSTGLRIAQTHSGAAAAAAAAPAAPTVRTAAERASQQNIAAAAANSTNSSRRSSRRSSGGSKSAIHPFSSTHLGVDLIAAADGPVVVRAAARQQRRQPRVSHSKQQHGKQRQRLRLPRLHAAACLPHLPSAACCLLASCTANRHDTRLRCCRGASLAARPRLHRQSKQRCRRQGHEGVRRQRNLGRTIAAALQPLPTAVPPAPEEAIMGPGVAGRVQAVLSLVC